MKLSREVLAGLALTVVAVSGVRADMGSVWVEAAGKEWVRLAWSGPDGTGHRVATGTPYYRICWQRSEPGASLSGAPKECRAITGENSYKVEGLAPETCYRFWVEGDAERRNAYGVWVNITPELRQIGTVKQRTLGEAPAPSLMVASAGKTAVGVEFKNPEPERFGKIRIAYKARWSNVDLEMTAKLVRGPELTWGTSNAERGWVDLLSTGAVLQAEFSDLDKAREYEFVAYGLHGLNMSPFVVVRLAGAGGRTAGYSAFQRVEQALAVNHQDILFDYGDQLMSGGEPLVFDRVAPDHPELNAVRDLLLRDDGDDLEENLTAILYLIREMPAAFTDWQDKELNRGGLTLSGFLCRSYSGVCANLEAEIEPLTSVFQRGDANGSGLVDMSDAIRIMGKLFLDQGELACLDAADSNDNGDIDISDGIHVLNYLFGNGPEPSPPLGRCGIDPTADALDCEQYFGCRPEQ